MTDENIFAKYDLVDVDETVDIPDRPEDGVILVMGSSGSGKSTILKAWGMQPTSLDYDVPIHKLFETDLIAEHYLNVAGLRSVPAWLRPLSSVSNGEAHRAEIAVALANGAEFIDEFTSLVDRHTARALCHSLNKAKLDNIVVATCHADVATHLNTDHIYDADQRVWLSKDDRGSLRQDLPIKLKIRPVEGKEVWASFRRHHYLASKLNASSNCWCGYMDDKAVAFTSVIAQPSGTMKNAWREHRTVVLPEFQGMGIGTALSDTIGGMLVSRGYRFFSKTSHPAFGEHREKSPFWKATSKNKVIRKDYLAHCGAKEQKRAEIHKDRSCYSHEFIIPEVES